MTINLNEYISTPNVVLGKQGEYGREVTYDFSDWVERFGAGSIGWAIHRPVDTSAYLFPSTESGTISTITLTETEMAYSGTGELEVFYVNDGQTEKRISKTFSTYVKPSLQNVSEAPAPWQSYVDTVHEDALKAEEASQSILDLTATATVDSSVGTPSVSVEVTTEDDHKNMAFAFSNIKGEQGEQGETGNGISSVSVEKTATVGNVDTYTMTISYTDGDSDTATFDVTNSEVTEEEFEKAFPVDVAQGSIASYPDGAVMPVKDLKVSVTPVQDLHGQDNPYPAGGGKNKYPNSDISGTAEGVTITHNADESYKISGLSDAYRGFVASDTFTLKAGTYTLTRTASSLAVSESNLRMEIRSADGLTTYASTTTNPVNFTLASDTEVKARIVVGRSGVDFGTGIIYRFQIESGSSATSWSPYSNICPITGWTGANVVRTGANLNPNTGVNYTTSNATRVFCKAGTYTLSTNNGVQLGSNNQLYIRLFDAQTDGNTITSGNISGANMQLNSSGTLFYGGNGHASVTVTIAVDCWVAVGFNNQIPSNFSELQMEVGSTATDYHAYSSNTYSFPFGQTVYGGTLDVTTGVLTIEKKYKTPLKADWRRNSATQFYVVADTDIATGADVPCISDKFRAWNGTENRYNTPYICFVNDGGAVRVNSAEEYATVDEFWNALGESSFVCQLATPTTVQLSPTEVKSLLGQNNVFADCGDSEVEYLADVTLYIQKLTGSTEDDMVANQNIANNKYFMVGNRLFFSTSAIAQGASIVVGTNCTETNLADALNALNS